MDARETTDRRHFAARIWAMRAAAELEAADRFERLAQELERHGAASAVLQLARAATTDEHRHHELCVSLVEHFGARWRSPANPHKASPLSSGRGTPRADLLYELVAMSCVTETLSAALLVEMRDATTDPRVRAVVHEVLTDEVDHSRLGWAHLASEARHLDCRFLGPALPSMLAATVHEELFEDPADGTDLSEYGALPRSVRREIFAATMEDVVFPGLREYGIDTRPAQHWLDDRLGRAWSDLASAHR